MANNIRFNPHASMIAFDPTTKDMNNFIQVGDRVEKGTLLKKYLNEYNGQQKHVVNLDSGEVRVWEFSTSQRQYYQSRTQLVHLLFGRWRLASPEDIARQNKQDAERWELKARQEAQKKATQAGIMFGELGKAAHAIDQFNKSSQTVKADEDSEVVRLRKELDTLRKTKTIAEAKNKKEDVKPEKAVTS